MKRKRGKLAKKKISDDLRTIRGSLAPITFDLIPDILKALPVKTLARFLCVSKQYESIIRNKDFMKSYLIKSSTRPQSLIFTFEDKSHRNRFFFSASCGESSSPSSSSVATYHMKCISHPETTVSPSVHGLICYGPPNHLMVYNPSTRRSVTLPQFDSHGLDMYHFLGYDPINEDYKVLCMMKRMTNLGGYGLAKDLRVLTLGNGNSWRMIQDCPPPHSPESLDICINGVLYYEAVFETDEHQAVMSFDVRSEKFDLIKVLESATLTKLTSYEGKLAVMNSTTAGISCTCRIDLWVLVDAAKHEWCNKVFALDLWITECCYQAFCLTDAGEFVLGPDTLRGDQTRFSVLYYDPKKNSLRKVYIEGITERTLPLRSNIISIFSGQVENLMFL